MAVASNNAILNIGRLNAFRLNYVDPALKKVRDTTLSITLDGVPLKVRLGSLQIHDVINDAPNTATLVVDDATPPTVGKRLRVTLGIDPSYLLFAGTLQAARQSYVGRAHADAWACEAIDDTARADWLRPFGAWEGVSATTVAQQVIASFAPGFSSAGVQAGLLPVTVYLDGTERVNGALRLLAKLAGGYYYFEDYVLHLFTGDEPGANPDDVTGAPGQLLEDPRLEAASDDSQIRTRCYGKGHSEPTLSAVNAGDTLIPIENAVMFNAFGGKAISEWQRLTYTGTAIGGAGALVGPGVTPSAAPVAMLAAGTGVTPGSHVYAYTWVTAGGATLASPLTSAIVTTAAESGPPIYALNPQPNLPNYPQPAPGTTLDYALSKQSMDGAFETPRGPITSGPALAGQYYYPSILCTADMAGNRIILWRRDNGGAWGVLGNTPVTTQPVGGVFSIPDTLATAPPRADPAGNFASGRVQITGISSGPAGVTGRRLYRSKANTTTPLYGVASWPDNTTSSFLDAVADAALNTADTPPATDSSGLQMPAGQVLPGAASMPVSGTGWARAAGGWAVVGNGAQVIRYTGISGNSLTGIPATGPGAIVAAVNYNSTLTGAPMLLGVGGLSSALRAGAPVNIWVQVDDTAAQAALAARVGGSGIVEHLIVDERRGEPSLVALCTADLALYSRPIVTVRYTTFDPKSRSGRPVRVHLTQPAIDQTLTIQDVTIATSDGHGPPRFTVTASSIRTSLEDLLRRMVGTLEEGF
jgi:hypothetical protein